MVVVQLTAGTFAGRLNAVQPKLSTVKDYSAVRIKSWMCKCYHKKSDNWCKLEEGALLHLMLKTKER